MFDNQQSSLLDITASINRDLPLDLLPMLLMLEIWSQLFLETLYVNLPTTLI